MIDLIIRPQASQRIRQGQRLLQEDDIDNLTAYPQIPDGSVATLISPDQTFQGYALVARQHKGFAWVFSRDPEDTWGPGLVKDRLEAAKVLREDLLASSETTAFRLFNGEGDGIGGWTADNYADYVQINWYSYGIYRFKDWIIQALRELYPHIQGIYSTRRFGDWDQASEAVTLDWGQPAPSPYFILENGIRYEISLGQDWMTGLFLDQREVRRFIRDQAQGQTLLNLFSYTGAFSLAAAVGGAQATTSVDIAKRSLPKSQANFQANALDLAGHDFKVMDVFSYLDYAQGKQLDFDWVVCDPPSFSRSGKGYFQAEKDYGFLASQVFALTRPGGMAVFSTNHSAYSRDAFREDLLAATKTSPGTYHLIQSFGQPQDFPASADPSSQYLKVFVFYREK